MQVPSLEHSGYRRRAECLVTSWGIPFANWTERNFYQIGGTKTTTRECRQSRTARFQPPLEAKGCFDLLGQRPQPGGDCTGHVSLRATQQGPRDIVKVSKAALLLEGDSMPEPTYEELKAKLAELETKQQKTGSLQFKVSEKGGVSVYGLGRFPVTLYYEQWTRLLDAIPQLREFLEENKSKLKLKTT
jgi:hypothetical protein